MKKTKYPLSRVYGLLEPGPVVLLTTQGKGRRPNAMTLSWHMMMEFEPPLVGCVVSNRNYTFEILRETKECVINIPTVELAKKVVACGNSSGRKRDKFKKYGLTAEPAESVKVPRIAECYANLECRVADTTMVESYGMFVLEVVSAWIDPARKWARTMHHMGMGEFMLAGKRLKLRSKMK
jgi:flavin reductase (DIM6/NTAB) family NADH-FMN oxidoreductase RutF